jgi:hypothetical protein
MEDFYKVLQHGFIYLQVLEKKKIKAGEELFCDYHGDIWFEMEATDSLLSSSTAPPQPTILTEAQIVPTNNTADPHGEGQIRQ